MKKKISIFLILFLFVFRSVAPTHAKEQEETTPEPSETVEEDGEDKKTDEENEQDETEDVEAADEPDSESEDEEATEEQQEETMEDEEETSEEIEISPGEIEEGEEETISSYSVSPNNRNIRSAYSNTRLTASYQGLAEDKQAVKLRLVYAGRPREGINLGSIKRYITFKFPEEIQLAGDEKTATSYESVSVNLHEEGKKISTDRNTVEIKYSYWLSLGSISRHTITLDVEVAIDSFQENINGEYNFSAIGTKENAIDFNSDQVSGQSEDTVRIDEDLGSLKLSTPEHLSFGTVPIGTKEIALADNSPHKIQITDERLFAKEWQLTATADPLTTNKQADGGVELPLVLKRNEEYQNLQETTEILTSSEKHEEISLKDPTNKLIVLTNDQNVHADVEYNTTITWTLSDAP